MPLSPRAVSACALLVMLAGVTACGDSTGPRKTTPAALTLLTSGAVTGTAGLWLDGRVVVKVTSATGDSLPGIPVSFTTAPNSGGIFESDAVTKADGTASAIWTLGTVAGKNIDTLRVSSSRLPGKSVMVIATVQHSKPETLFALSGDKQVGTAGAPLPQPLVVIARDQHGNPVEGVAVSWTVDGGGTLSATSSITDTTGTASVVWTMGTGTNRARAVASGLSPGSAIFTAAFANSGAVTLASVSPATLFEGQTATLTGTGFSPTIANDAVFVDGAPASITSASATSLTITVPTFDCRPSRNVDIRVTVSGDNSNIVSHALAITTPTVQLAPGQELIVTDPGNYCLQLEPQAPGNRYLIGVQSVSEAVSSLTPVQVTAVNASGAMASMVPASPLAPRASFLTQGSGLDLPISARSRRWVGQRTAETRIRTWEHEHLDDVLRRNPLRTSSRSASISALAVPSTVTVGDTIPIQMPDITGDLCTSSIPVTTVVREVGARGIWLEDVTDPANGYTSTDFQHLSALLDNPIYDTDVSYFGTPEDIDGNGRIVVVISKEVNKFGGVLGFVTSADLVPQATCPASNEGEFFYGAAPDPSGTFALGTYDRTAALGDAPVLIAHEFTHIIQFEVRSQRGAPNMASWTAEGQATLAEEVVGNAVEGRSPGQDYGLEVAFNLDDPSSTDWYSDRFIDMATYYGYVSQTSQLASAPQECSWLAQHPANPGPCIGGRDVYGVPWSILRWLSDQFGPTFPGGEQGLQRALIDNDAVGYANLENVVHVPIDTLLAQWAAMLVVDDRMPGADPRLSMPSWNLLYIFFFPWGNVSLPATAHLLPHEHPYADFTESFNVRAGSAAYMLLNGTAGGSMAMGIRIRTPGDGPLPPNMQIFIVRTG